MFDTPILFIIFNRLESTQKVFSEIRKQKPRFLFVAADGPRAEFEEDRIKCKKVRSFIIENIDWDCEVKTLFRETNLGCGKGVSSAIDWFFENVESGIILEDDCLPHPSFFGYCASLLEKYADNPKIFGINGTNFQIGEKKGGYSYFFSNYIFVWGWATWKRAWENYDFEMKNYEEIATDTFFKRIDKRRMFRKYWKSKFDMVYANKIDTWDYQWLFTIWKYQGLIVVPKVNLISNIGFGPTATHTTNLGPHANLETKKILKLKHPNKIRVNKRADRIFSRNVFNIENNGSGVLEMVRLLFDKLFLKLRK